LNVACCSEIILSVPSKAVTSKPTFPAGKGNVTVQVTRPLTGGGQLVGIGTLNEVGPTYAGMVVLSLKLVIVIPSDATLAVRYFGFRVRAAVEPVRAGYESRRTAVAIPADGLGMICVGADDPVVCGTLLLPPPLHPARSVRAATEHSCLSNVVTFQG
jgi:hypothetical protein